MMFLFGIPEKIAQSLYLNVFVTRHSKESILLKFILKRNSCNLFRLII